MNEVKLMGSAGHDVSIKFTPTGLAIGEFSLATSSGYKDANGEWVNSTEWHHVVIIGKLNEYAETRLKKGSKVFVSGKLETKTWEKDGVKKYKTQIVARDLLIEPKQITNEDDFPL